MAALATDPPFTVDEVSALTVDMLALVSVDDLLGLNPVVFDVVLTDEALAATEADLSLQADPALTRSDDVVPWNAAGYTVPDWLSVDGRPKAVTGLTLVVGVTATVGALAELTTYPDPYDVDVPADERWLPDVSTFTAGGTEWFPYSELTTSTVGYTVDELAALTVDEVAALRVSDLYDGVVITNPVTSTVLSSSTGMAPVRRQKFLWTRGPSRTSSAAIVFDKGAGMWTDDISFARVELTMLLVAVLRPPASDWYPVLEVSPTDRTIPVDPLSLRYTAAGDLVLWGGSGVLASTTDQPLYASGAGFGRPVVLGLNVDMEAGVATMIAMGRTMTMREAVLPQLPDPASRLWLGRSPSGQQAFARMGVLEVAVFETPFSDGQLESLLSTYDRMYGVSAS